MVGLFLLDKNGGTLMKTKEFIEKIHGENIVHFRALGKGYPISLKGKFSEVEEKLRKLNTEGRDIYFTVNGGGTKKEQINQINAVFVDFDCGRDADKNYLALSEVEKFKKEKLDSLLDFAITPSIIVETRNGLHAYWLLEDGCSVDEFSDCQLRLIEYFGSDEAVKTPERIMRLPGFYWMKDIHNPFWCDILDSNSNLYGIDRLLCSLPSSNDVGNADSTRGFSVLDNKYNNSINYLARKTSNPVINYNIKAILDGNIEYLKSVLEPEGFIAKTEQELYDYLTREINLRHFLGVPDIGNFQCIFHDDRSPSASIMADKDTGFQIYKCFSSNCNAPIVNIIHSVEILRECKRYEAIEFLKQVYDVVLEKSEWQQEWIMILESNKRMIMNGEIEEIFPNVYKIIKPYLPQLIILHDIAIENLRDEEHTDNSGDPVFFISRRKLMDILNARSGMRITQRNVLFAFLKLIKKLHQDEIPKSDLEKAIKLRTTYNHRKIVNYFSVPAYDYERMMEANQRVEMYVAYNLRIGSMNREGLLRSVGEEITKEVFPQYYYEIGRGFSKKSEEIVADICTVINLLIDTTGYALKSEVIDLLADIHGKVAVKKQFDKSLYQIIKMEKLLKLRCNAGIKVKYGVKVSGYPVIFVRDEDMN